MRKLTTALLSAAIVLPLSFANAQVITRAEQQKMEKQGLGGGKGTVAAAFAFTRDKAGADQAIKEISWLTLQPGTSIGYHKHINNEDAYIIVSGSGIFKDTDGKDYPVTAGDITIVREGQSHGLTNNGKQPLVVVDVIAAR
ncbi:MULTISPECIES: cupin domain-containing protein [Tatumella]|uniref:Cupin domain-containing protein n=1 Tax=Tatumella punctata TaxID=399969 RepID=A0ABW1VR16_9GAMM|nr:MULTISPECIES: cupin domain-containing protein [unclassified Tatumella]MBS0857538.1 cupin domain-containing protein [Tatumella sp. JGM16]MBS0878366.1 cupin domain-containing protein [Tatumella sp. JGM82]MBS0891162.1 cupin domain-containing protein [Tatumella sp. JGM94]MBS0894796.1 cupin domain-containing protein [Tatumella sp. JGM130]MBS0902719.1 cupin domain-containing protein [Tatumella sp. JGM100]